MQRTAHASARALAVEHVGFVERRAAHVRRRVEEIFVLRDAIHVEQHELARRDAARFERRLHLRDRGFDDVEAVTERDVDDVWPFALLGI